MLDDLKNMTKSPQTWAAPTNASRLPELPFLKGDWTKSLQDKIVDNMRKISWPSLPKGTMPEWAPSLPSGEGLDLIPLPRRWKAPEMPVDRTLVWLVLIASVVILGWRMASISQNRPWRVKDCPRRIPRPSIRDR